MPQGRLACRNSVCPVSDAPFEVTRASFREKFVTRVQEVGSHGRVLGELGVRVDKHDIFSLALPHGEIDVIGFSCILLVQAGVTHAHNVL